MLERNEIEKIKGFSTENPKDIVTKKVAVQTKRKNYKDHLFCKIS